MSRVYSIIAILAILLTTGSVLRAQEHSYAHYDVHAGLAGATVYSMAQDKDGFIWFGTETGVSRFDGTHFVNFSTRDGLPDNEVLKVFVDSRNRVWMIPFKHSICYYYKGKFHNQENDSVLRKLKLGTVVNGILEDSAGSIVLWDGGILHFIQANGHIRELHTPKSYVVPANYALIVMAGLNSRHQVRLIYSYYGMNYCDVIGDSLHKLKTIENAWFNNPLVTHLYPDLETYAQGDTLIFEHPVTGEKHIVRKPKGFIGLTRINDSSVALNTYSSTYLFNMRQWKITDSFLMGLTVNSVLEDSEGSLWFSTLGRGVYRLGSSEVSNYYFSLKGNNLGIYSIGKSEDALYFGGDHYFTAKLDRRTGVIQKGVLDSTNTRGRVTAMLQLDGNRMLAGTDLGIFVFREPGKPAKFVGLTESIKSMTIARDSLLLFSSDKYTQLWSLSRLETKDTLWMLRATCSRMLADGTFLLGTVNGLYRVKDRLHSQWLGDTSKVFARRISAMAEDVLGTVWIATDGEGIAGYRDGKMTIQITENEGLTSNICRTIYVDGRNVWVGTDKGLSKISWSGDTYSITPFTMSDGLSSDEINAIYVEGHNVYVGDSEGLTFFDETKISKRSHCELRMTDIKISGQSLPLDSNDFLLSHKNNNIQFDFVGISYRSAGNIRYRYRLIGLDSSWKETDETFLSYPSLPSGNYELQLAATNKFGVESKLLSVRFVVDKLVWERWWFRVLVLLLTAGGVFYYFQYRLRKLRRKETEKSETNAKIAELEQMALRSQMNPHFIFNCLNSIQQYVIYRDVLGANEFITKFSYLIRQTLDISSRQSISLYEEINYIDTYMSLEKKRFDDKFIYEIVVGPEVDKGECHIPPMILQPYIENSIRHGIGLRNDQKGKLTVKMFYRAGRLVCSVEDNGVGRKIAMKFKSVNSIQYQSVGMSLVSKRIEMINKSSPHPVNIEIEDMEEEGGVSLGTRVNLYFPLEIVLLDR